MSGEQQREFGWSLKAHRQREAALAALKLPRAVTCANGSAGEAKIRSLLHRLNYYAGGDVECFPGVARLAQELGCGERTVRRAIEAAQRLGLLAVELKRSDQSRCVCNHYRIVWPEVERLGSYKGHPETHAADVSEAERSDMVTDRLEERSDMVSRPIGHDVTTDRTWCHERSDMVTTDPIQDQTKDSSSDLWAEAEAAVRRVLGSWRRALEAAKRAGLNPGQVVELVEFFETHRTRWRSPGVLLHRIENATADMPASEGWPPASGACAVRERAEAEQRDRSVAESLEASHGAVLDGLSEAERLKLARNVFPAGSGLLHIAEHWGRSRLTDPRVRVPLLQALAVGEAISSATARTSPGGS